MLKLLLVGDKPSSKNADPNIAFIGTQSHKTIMKWLKVIANPNSDVILVNRVDPSFATHLIYASLSGYKIVALGEEAAVALVNFGVANYFKLPHPSGRNRKLNNKKYVADILSRCKTWIEES